MNQLPSGWRKVKVSDVCLLINGRAFKPDEWSTKGLPIIRIQNLNNKELSFNYCDFPVDNKYYIKNGDLLFCWSGTPGTSFGAHIWDRGDAVLNQHIFKVIIDDQIFNKKFMMYTLNNNVNEYVQKAHGTAGLAHITKSKFEDSDLLVPPLREQRRIVAKIEELFSRLDAGVEALNAIKAKVIQYRQSVLKEAFEGKYSRKGTKKIAKFKELIEEPRYGTSKKCDYNKIGKAVLRIPNILNNIIDASDLKYAEFTDDEILSLQLKCGDILIIRSNGSVSLVGRAAIVRKYDINYLFAGYLIRIRLKDSSVEPKFLLYYLSSPSCRKYIERIAKSTSGVYNINSNEIKSIEIPVFDLEDQHITVKEIEHRFSICDKVERTIDENLKRAEKLRQSILKRAFEGKLVPQDPSDEPADILLERIKQEKARLEKENKTRRTKANGK